MANITAALRASGRWDDALLWVSSDNGGVGPGNNHPREWGRPLKLTAQPSVPVAFAGSPRGEGNAVARRHAGRRIPGWRLAAHRAGGHEQRRAWEALVQHVHHKGGSIPANLISEFYNETPGAKQALAQQNTGSGSSRGGIKHRIEQHGGTHGLKWENDGKAGLICIGIRLH